jgi:hypothetical protein
MRNCKTLKLLGTNRGQFCELAQAQVETRMEFPAPAAPPHGKAARRATQNSAVSTGRPIGGWSRQVGALNAMSLFSWFESVI